MALLMAILMAAAVAPSLGMDYMVEWKLNVSYTQWADGKEFHLGDTLTFSYKPGVHNVLEVNKADWDGCTSSDPGAVPRITGNDTIRLDNSGDKWYICDIGEHCLQGMKLGIAVSEGTLPPNPGVGSSDARQTMTTLFQSHGWMLLVMVVAAYI